MMMMVLTYDVDLHITLLRPWSKHLKCGGLASVEVPNLKKNLSEKTSMFGTSTHRISDKLALVSGSLVRGQLRGGRRWSRLGWGQG